MNVKRMCFRFLILLALLSRGNTSLLADSLVCDDFELQDSWNESHALSDAKTAYKVLVFLGTECPLAKLSIGRLNELAQEFEGRVTFLGLNANCQDSFSEIAAFVKSHRLGFPILRDTQNRVADQLGAQRTPEAFLLDAANTVRYRGRIDDQYGVGYVRPRPTRSDLRLAITELLDGKPVSVTQTEAVGCHIGRVPKSSDRPAVTYSEQAAPILIRYCVDCHRPGEIAPFSLTSYHEVVGWGATIREVVEDRRMPPWHASAEHGTFANARSMAEEDRQTLLQWIEEGMAAGDLASAPLPPPRVEGWRLPREPDLVVSIGEGFEVPAEGVVEYQYFVVDPKLEQDRWVSAAEVVPGNRSVVHHAIVFVRPPRGEREDGIGWLTGYVPGQEAMSLPQGMARKIPAGSKLVFQLHYTPVGRVQHDRTKVGLIFTDLEQVHSEVQTRIAINQNFEIPPFSDRHRVTMSTGEFPAGSRLLAIVPHMHLRGHAFRVSAAGDDWQKILLEVPKYDFNWQHIYELRRTMPLDGVRIDCVATFDNSAKNPANPDPSQTVRWGDQTWEEMALAYLAIAVPLQTAETPPNRATGSRLGIAGRESRAEVEFRARENRAQQIAKGFFKSLDANRDGEILRAETPISFRAFSFNVFDENDDEKLTWEEVLRQARLSLRP